MARPKSRKRTTLVRPLSTPVAAILAVAVLVVLIIIGLNYSAFGGLLATKAAAVPPDPRVMKCVQDVINCTDQEAKDYDACTKSVNAELAACLKKIDPKMPKAKRDKAQADCEIKAGKDADLCVNNACKPGEGVPHCRTMADCVKKIPK